MKKLLVFALLAGGSYGIYSWLTTYAKAPIVSATSGQLEKGKAAVDAATRLQRQETARSVQAVVDRYKAEQGSFPASLQELVDRNLLSEIPPGVSYDASIGKVTAD